MLSSHLRYLNHHLTRQLNELYISTVIFAFSESILLIFVPVYLYKLGYGLTQILLYFGLHYLAYAVLMLVSGKIIARIGYEAAIGWSMPLYACYLASLALLPAHAWLFLISSVLLAIFKSMYWPAFHADFVKFSDSGARGEEVGALKVLVGAASVMGPAIGGFILARFGFSVILSISIVLSLLSLIPLFVSREPRSQEQFWIKNTVMKFFRPKYRNDVIANFGVGEDTIAQAVWPVFMFSVLASYQAIGAVTTAALFVTFVAVLIIGKLADRSPKSRLIKTTSSAVFLSWVIRIFSFNWLSIFASDALYNISKRTLDVPVQAIVYGRPRQDAILSYVIFREIALSLSKALTAILAGALIYFTGQIFLTFALAGALTLFYFYWTDQIAQEQQKQ